VIGNTTLAVVKEANKVYSDKYNNFTDYDSDDSTIENP
jgi:hypothetical protein